MPECKQYFCITMKVIRAKSAGFCWGVERAIDIAREFAEEGKRPVYTDGPLIHNKQMMQKLQDSGIKEVGDYQSKSTVVIDEEDKNKSVMVVRAHGISLERRDYLKNLSRENGMQFKDATCPDVGIIAGKIRLHAKKGFATVIFGDPNHPEVIGLKSYAENKGHVIETKEDIDNLPPLGDNVCMVSQSTMFTHEFQDLGLYLKSFYPTAVIIDTICGATKERQTDIKFLVDQACQAIIVIGGSHSANTKKLVKLAELHGLPTFHIETIKDLDLTAIQRYQTVGVTAGASTPDFLITEVTETLEAL